jgi:hypothetical protein
MTPRARRTYIVAVVENLPFSGPGVDRSMKPLILMFSLLAVPAFAQGGKLKELCSADAQKLCPGMAPHKGLHRCLSAHAAELSPACADALANAKAKHRDGQPPPAPAPTP